MLIFIFLPCNIICIDENKEKNVKNTKLFHQNMEHLQTKNVTLIFFFLFFF